MYLFIVIVFLALCTFLYVQFSKKLRKMKNVFLAKIEALRHENEKITNEKRAIERKLMLVVQGPEIEDLQKRIYDISIIIKRYKEDLAGMPSEDYYSQTEEIMRLQHTKEILEKRLHRIMN